MHDEQLRVLGGTVSWRAMTTTTFPGKKGCEEKRFAVQPLLAGPTDRSRQNSAKQLISINRKQNAILVMGSITAPTKGASAKMVAGEEGQMRAQLATISVCSRLTMHLPPAFFVLIWLRVRSPLVLPGR